MHAGTFNGDASINAIFFARRHPFNCFSRPIAF
jgi:hypothetical protein